MGKLKTVMKFILGLVVLGLLLVLFLLGEFIYQGGYWENMPLLDRLSGPKHFTRYVMDPIPSSVSNLRKGYSGFPQGQVTTYFKYSGSLSSLDFLEGWQESEPDRPEMFGLKISKQYQRVIQHEEGFEEKRFLLFDEEKKEGLLYIP